MASKENVAPNAMPDMMHVPQKAFEALKQKLVRGDPINADDVNELVNPTIKDDDVCVPVDMSGANENLDDFEAALQKLGAHKCAECFLQAQTHFEANKGVIPEDERPKPINGREYKEMYDMEDENDDDKPMYFPDIFYVPRTAFQAMKDKLAKSQSVTKEEVDGLVNWEPVDKEMYDPVDMKGADEDLDEFEEALEALGPQQIAQCFVQAFDAFEKQKHLLPTRKQIALTGKQWKDLYQEDGEEEGGDHGDEEEEEEDDGDEDDEEPADKKAKIA